jgi:hypothetical protein
MSFNFDFRKIFNDNFLLWAVVSGILIYVLSPILTNQILIGWDLPAHYYLVEQMLYLLEQGRISAFNIYGFAGYPIFTFYNPLPYLIVCLVHLFSFKTLPLPLCFNFILFLLPFFFLISVYYTAQVFFNDKRTTQASIIFGFLALFLIGNNGLGLTSQMNVGLFLNAFACPIMIFLLGTLEKTRQTKNKKYLLWSIVLFSILVLSHIFTALFFCFVLLVYALFYFRQTWKQLFIFGFCSAILTSFWWAPFLLNIGYTSAQNIVTTTGVDPFFSIFPKFLFGLFLFIFSILGIIRLIKQKSYFLPALFIASLLLIPRDVINYLIKLPIHYYRFVSDVAVINIFISACGFVSFGHWINNWSIWKKNHFLFRIPWTKIFIVYLACLMVSINLNFFDVKKFQNDLNPNSNAYRQDISDAIKLTNYLKDNNLTGRVLVDLDSNALLTKHYFDYLLPKAGIYNARGLLYESSLSGRYIYSETGLLFDYSNLMSIVYFDNKSDDKDPQTIEAINTGQVKKIKDEINKLAIYGIKYIVAENARSVPLIDFVNSDDNDLAIIKNTFGRFTLIEIKNTSPFFGETDYHPFLFVDSGGIFKKLSFADFSLQWQRAGFSLDHPLVYTPKGLKTVSKEDQERLGGYLVSYNNDGQYCPSMAQMEYWQKFNKPIIFLDSDNDCSKPSDNFYFVKTKEDSLEINQVYDLIAKISPNKWQVKPLEGKIQNEQLEITSNSGIFINFSYFPKWQSLKKNQTIFWITPSLMFVFGNGETTLNYK